MGYDPSVLRRAAARLRQQTKEREARQETLRQEVYAACPRISEIDGQLRRTVADAIALSFRTGEDPLAAMGELRTKNLALQEERSSLLLSLGHPADALDGRPLCAQCGDTGWVGAKMCGCLKALCTQEQTRVLSKLLNLGEHTFDTFSIDWYSEEPWPGETRSPRENMEFIYEVCRHYAQKFGAFYFDNLLFTGPPGLGKTFLSACIARVVSERGFSVVYDGAVSIFDRFAEGKFSRDGEAADAARDETRRYLNCDLLILDDLGSELTTPYVQSALYTLLNTRLQSGKRTVISTNLTMEELGSRYSVQAASRLDGEYQVLRFYGEDIRGLKKRSLQ